MDKKLAIKLGIETPEALQSEIDMWLYENGDCPRCKSADTKCVESNIVTCCNQRCDFWFEQSRHAHAEYLKCSHCHIVDPSTQVTTRCMDCADKSGRAQRCRSCCSTTTARRDSNLRIVVHVKRAGTNSTNLASTIRAPFFKHDVSADATSH